MKNTGASSNQITKSLGHVEMDVITSLERCGHHLEGSELSPNFAYGRKHH